MEIVLSKKTCVITGVGWGTGNAIARRFADSGYSVAMLARRGDRLEQLESEIENAHAFPCDVTDTTALKETLKKITKDSAEQTIEQTKRYKDLESAYKSKDVEVNKLMNDLALVKRESMTMNERYENCAIELKQTIDTKKLLEEQLTEEISILKNNLQNITVLFLTNVQNIH